MAKGKDISYRHETEVAGLFTKWWGAPFARTPNSGALRWNGSIWTFGDVLPPDDFPGVLECKRRKVIDWHRIIDPALDVKHKDHPLSWWTQAQEDAARAYTATRRPVQPIVLCKTIRKRNRIFIESDLYAALGGRKLHLPSMWVTHSQFTPFVILDLATFFAAVDREAFLLGVRSVIPAALVEAAA